MSSESIVVLIFVALAIGFIIWVRRNSHDHDPVEQANNTADEAKHSIDRR